MNKPKRLLAVALAAAGLVGAGSALAQSDSAMIVGGGAHYGAPHMVRTAVVVSLGWHGDRYYDGHRYWGRDEWMHRHPHDSGPRGWHRDDHHH